MKQPARGHNAFIFSALVFAAVGLLLATLAPGAFAANVPSRTLRFGDQGEDVRALQVALNTSPDTQVSQSGAGSPGEESNYFGLKTLDAVKRFQNKYQAEILSPLGLVSATGFVGPATLKKLQSLTALDEKTSVLPGASELIESSTSVSPATSSPVAVSSTKTPIPLMRDMQIPAGVNPNSINLDYFIATIDALGKEQGVDASELLAIESAIRSDAATTTDFRKKFFEEAKLKNKQATAHGIPAQLASILERALVFLGFAHVAEAQAVNAPFGGALYFAYPCSCSLGVWLISIQPLPPTYPVALSYVIGTELFASYNIPFTTELLGFYTPNVQKCYQHVGYYCPAIPNRGLITPFVGSSPE